MTTEHMPITKMIEKRKKELSKFDTERHFGARVVLEQILPQVKALEGELIARAKDEERERVWSIIDTLLDNENISGLEKRVLNEVKAGVNMKKYYKKPSHV